MRKGQWIMISCMVGEPQMTGKIGQYEFTDDIGQIHGTWGIAIQPDKDSFVMLTDEQVAEIKANEEKKKAEFKPPYVEGAKEVELEFDAVPRLSRMEWPNGVKPTTPIKCKVNLDLNGRYKRSVEERKKIWTVIGVPDNACREVYERIKHNIGRDCCPICIVMPCDVRKSCGDYMPAIDKACKLAIGEKV